MSRPISSTLTLGISRRPSVVSGTAQAHHLVSAHVGVRLRRGVGGRARSQGHWPMILAGVVLCGPLLCATSQAVNDWFDRHVDAINEPLGRSPPAACPGRWGLYIAMLWTLLSHRLCGRLGGFGYSARRPRGWCSPGPTARRRSGSSRMAGGAIWPARCAMRDSPGSRVRRDVRRCDSRGQDCVDRGSLQSRRARHHDAQ